jgi:hypothetical protein
MNATVIYQDLFTKLGFNAVSCRTVTRRRSPTREAAVEPDPSATDAAITQALSDEPFALVCEFGHRTWLPKVAP